MRAVQCPSCGHEAPAASRFCPDCGHALTQRGDERRVVTVVFADLVGFTSLSESLDPEQVKNLVDGCFAKLADDVVSFGGRVDKVVGDALVALFGAPIAHEDDAERAVRAGLRMQATLADHAAIAGIDVRMRVGINTGEVLVGALRAGGDYTAMGDVVNLASRLQALAPPGRVLVGAATHFATEAVIRYEPLGPTQTRGREAIEEAWLALAPIAPPGRRPRRGANTMVGRQHELDVLLGACRLAFDRHRALVVVINGEGGVGKSRLAEELASTTERTLGAIVLEGHCVPYGESNAWFPLALALRRHLGIEPHATTAEARSKTTAGLAAVIGTVERADVTRTVDGLLFLMGFDSPLAGIDPTRARDELTRSVLAFFDALARTEPVLLLIADVQSADPLMLDLLEWVVGHLGALPFALVTTARDGEGSTWVPKWGRHTTIQIRLDPLDREAASQLLDEVLGEGADPALVGELLDRSGGNPFFLEELARLVRTEGEVAELPGTLRGLVSARLDGLTHDERSMLDNAAVFGATGNWQGLVSFGVALGQSPKRETLVSLAAKDVLDIDGDEWTFRSDAVRDVAYQTLTKSARAQRHAGIGTAMVRVGDEHPGYAERAAWHYAAAAELVAELGPVRGVPRDVAPRAVDWLLTASEHAQRGATDALAVRLATRGLAVLDALGPHGYRRSELLLLRARGLAGLHRLDEARLDADDALERGRGDHDDAMVAAALVVLGTVEVSRGEFLTATTHLDEATAMFATLGDLQGRASALRQLGMASLLVNEYHRAEGLVAEARQLFIETGDRVGEGWADQNLAWIAFARGDIEQSERQLDRAAATFGELGDRLGLGWVHGLLAFVRFQQGRLDEAESLAVQVAADATELGERWAPAMMGVLLSGLRLWAGRTSEALALAEQSRKVMHELGDPHGETQALVPLARALVALGRLADASRAVEEAHAAAAASGVDRLASALAAGAAVHVGDGRRAVAEAVVVTEDGPSFFDAEVNLALGLLQSGEVEAAQIALDKAVDGVTDGERTIGTPLPRRPFGSAASALVLAAAGRPVEARAAAFEVTAEPGASYFDEVLANIGLACAAAQQGAADEALDALRSARAAADGSEDRVMRAVAHLAEAEVLTVLDDPRAEGAEQVAWARLADLGLRRSGWVTAVRLAARGGRTDDVGIDGLLAPAG